MGQIQTIKNLNLNMALDCEEIEEIRNVDMDEGNFFFATGVKFCPKTECVNNELIGTLDSTNPVEEEQGTCFKVFKRVFEKLKDNNLIEEYDIDEVECFIEASHPDYSCLNFITMVQTPDYYGIGFDLVNCKIGILLDTIAQVKEIEYWLNRLIAIIKEIKPEFDIVKNDNLNYKIEHYINFEMYSKMD